MKLGPLLAEYLFTNKQLDLPGIGTFRIQEPEMKENEDLKQTTSIQISFQEDTSIKEVPDLINFIASKSGKMKVLAASDLESHLEIAQQFLNIDKPFLLEGIGTLVKLSTGPYEFKQADFNNEKKKDLSAKGKINIAEESFRDYGTTSQRNIRTGKWLPVLLILAGIAIAAWVGYKIYQNKVSRNNEFTSVTEQKTEKPFTVISDSSQAITKKDVPKVADSVAIQKPITAEGKYKFVIEEAGKERALLRYNSLKSWGLQIQMETPDSVNYKLFFMLPTPPTDTAKTMDSLRILYTPAWSRSYVEH